MRDVCEREKIDCLDLAARLPGDTNAMYDDCHLNLAGCATVADLLADYFAPRLQEPR